MTDGITRPFSLLTAAQDFVRNSLTCLAKLSGFRMNVSFLQISGMTSSPLPFRLVKNKELNVLRFEPWQPYNVRQ